MRLNCQELDRLTPAERILTYSELPELIHGNNGLKRNGLRVVVALGVFDILHVGHINYLEAAAKHASVLLVGLENDEAVRLNKGPGRPVNTLQERMLAVAALSCVDLVFGFDDAPDYTDPASFQTYVDRYATLKATIAIPATDPQLIEVKTRQVLAADTICQDEGYGAVDAVYITGVHPNSTTRMLNEVGY